MTYQTERMDDGTVVIENQTIKGGIVLDVSKNGAIIRNCTFMPPVLIQNNMIVPSADTTH